MKSTVAARGTTIGPSSQNIPSGWPGHFAQHGYRTCQVGKMHFGGKNQKNGFPHCPYGDPKHGLGNQPDPIEISRVTAAQVKRRFPED